MKKLLLLSLLVVSAVGCSKDKSSGGGGAGAFKDSEVVRAFKKAGGHSPSVAELTATGWCELHEEGADEYENLVFKNDGTMKFVMGKISTNQTQTLNATYTLNGGMITATVEGQVFKAQSMVAAANGETGLLIQTEEGEQVVYAACAQM